MRWQFKKLYRVYKFLGLSWIIKEFWVLLLGTLVLIESWVLLESSVRIVSWVLIGSQILIGSLGLIGSWILSPLRVLGSVFLVHHFQSGKKCLTSKFFYPYSGWAFSGLPTDGRGVPKRHPSLKFVTHIL